MSIHQNETAAVSADGNLSYRALIIGLAINHGKSTHPYRVPECVIYSLWQSVADGCPVSPMVLGWLYRRQSEARDTQSCSLAYADAECSPPLNLSRSQLLITQEQSHITYSNADVLTPTSSVLLLNASSSPYQRGLRYE